MVALLIGADESRSDLDELAEPKDSPREGTAKDGALEFLEGSTRLVDVKGSDGLQAARTLKIVFGLRDVFYKVLTQDIDVDAILKKGEDLGLDTNY